MKILALEPYYGGSHKAFLDGLKKHSSHEWTILGLPAYKWKWRMRHSAVTFAEQVHDLIKQGQNWDILFCSDMLNLAEFLGLADISLRKIPSVAYFHENQLTYPLQNPDEQDLHPAVINFTTCLAASKVWFNSEFHRSSYLVELEKFLKRMPDYNHIDSIKIIKQTSSVVYPGIENISKNKTRNPSPIRILWAARWEYDKDPETFFNAIKILNDKNIDFNLSVIGSNYSEIPSVFDKAKKEFGDKITNWGYQETREDYIKVLQNSDVVVSTAQHEFFGISMIEAITAGAIPLLPYRLSYPELLGEQNQNDFFYDGSIENLADKLINLNSTLKNRLSLWNELGSKAALIVKKFQWINTINNIDAKFTSIIGR